MDVSKKRSALRDAEYKGRILTSIHSALTCPAFNGRGLFRPWPHAFLGSEEATYGLREGGAGFHRNRPSKFGAGQITMPLVFLIAFDASAGIVGAPAPPDGEAKHPRQDGEGSICVNGGAST